MYLDATPELRGYSGMCLPKDTKAIMNLMEELNINLDLIKSISLRSICGKKVLKIGSSCLRLLVLTVIDKLGLESLFSIPMRGFPFRTA